MYTINSDNVSYVVPLDHIDLGYLKRNIEVGDTVAPLWTPQQKEYTQFQLKAWRKNPDDSHIKKNVTTKCHICNISVPIIYIKEHNNSIKHKNYLKIICEALERVKNNTNAEFTTPSKSELSLSTYFCEACCVIVSENEKRKHINSTVHEKMQIQDDITEKFSELFRKDNVANSNDSNNNCVPKNFENKKSSKYLCLDQLQKYIRTLKNKYSSALMGIEVVDENFISIKVHCGTLKVHIDNFNSFEKTNNNNLLCLLCDDVVKENHMWTEMHMENVARPLSDQHCIRQIHQNYAHCIICNELISNVGLHKDMSSDHKIKLKNAQHNVIKGTTCQHTQMLVRQPEDTVPKLAELNKNKNVTTKSNENKGNTQTLVTNREAVSNLPEDSLKSNKSNKENLDMLVAQTDKGVQKLPEPNKNVTHQTKTIEGNKELQKVQPDETQQKSSHYLMCDTPNPKELLCRVCLCVIPSLLSNVNDHLQGKNHKKKYAEYLSINKLEKVANGFACDFCRLHVPDKTEIRHVSSEAHKKNMEAGIQFNVTYCGTCYIYIDTHNIEGHRNGQKHKQKEQLANGAELSNNGVSQGIKNYAQVAATSKAVQENKTETRVQSLNTVTNSVQSSSHLNSANNVKSPLSSNMIQKPTSEMKTIQPSTPTVESAQPIVNTKLHYHLKQTTKENILSCKICNVNITNGTDNITTHVTGFNHTKSYDKLLLTNGVKKVQFNFHCHKCDVPITSKNELDHIFGSRHRNNASNLSETDSIKTSSTKNNIELTSAVNNVTPSTSQTKKVQTNVQNDLKGKCYLFKKSANINELICRVCNVKVPNTTDNLNSHANGNNHKQMYEKLLKSHLVFDINLLNSQVEFDLNLLTSRMGFESAFFCSACFVLIPLQHELRHIVDLKHIDALISKQTSCDDDTDDDDSPETEFFCDFCSLIDDVSTFEEHQISIDHVTNIQKISNGTLDLQKDSRTKSKSTLKCFLCDCYVGNNYTCVMEHIQGSTHKSIYSKLLDMNKICTVGDQLYCLACKDIIISQQEFKHIGDPNHTGNLSLMS